jgi:hypothetical protein
MTALPTPADERRRELRTELDAVTTAHAEARARFGAAEAALAELQRSSTLTTENGKRGRRLEGHERIVAEERLSRERTEAALALGDAIGRLRAAKAAVGAAQLSELRPEYEAAAGAVEEQRRKVERAYARLLGEGWELLDAHERERVAARRLTQVAIAAAPSEDAREDVRHAARDRVPVALGEDGDVSELVDRPETALFGLDGYDPRGESFADVLGYAIRGGRAHGPGRLHQRALEAVQQVGISRRDETKG